LAIIPPNATFESYVVLFLEEEFLLWIWNSFSITMVVASVGVIVASTGAYAFSRWRFPGRRPALIFLLTTQMIPAGMLIIPIFVIVAQLQLTNNIIGLMLAYIATAIPFSIWILKGYYDTIPPDLEEAAMVDGCNRLESFWRIILPLSTPRSRLYSCSTFWGLGLNLLWQRLSYRRIPPRRGPWVSMR
jgi:arabinogalactan oligomer/maltooligosaccharide transport system permease protein